MKGAFLAAAAALAGTAMADVAHMRRHGHDAFHERRQETPTPGAEATCGCTTEVITLWGSPTLVPIATATPSTVTSQVVTTLHSTSYSTVTLVVTPSASPAVELPTPGLSTFSSTGVYTIPASTVTVSESTTVPAATSTELPSGGTYTVGGVTTVVETETTIVCPYATVVPSGTTVTSIIDITTYVCPSAGTYTIAPITTSVPTSTVLVYPTPATITPGTYTQPEQTVTVTRTDYTYVCPFATTTTPVAAVVATSAASTSSAVATSSALPQAVSGTQLGMTYTPYTNSSGCKTQQQITDDVSSLRSKGFDMVRLYSTDCNVLEYIGDVAASTGLKMILGVFIDGSGASAAQPQITAITQWAKWEYVSFIVVGNEAISSGYMTAATLAGFIASSKQAFESAGYTGEVTTTEPIDIWQSYGSTLCPAVDVVGANIHPFFNAQTTAEQAGSFAAEELSVLETVCPGKEVYNLETGWPHAGGANGAAVPSEANQATAIAALKQAVGTKSVFFSYEDDDWKQPGEFGVEQFWGCIDHF